MPLARMAAPMAINTTGQTYRARSWNTFKASRRKTTPKTTNTRPATAAVRWYDRGLLVSIGRHLTDPDREPNNDARDLGASCPSSRRGQVDHGVESGVVSARHVDVTD